MTKKRCSIENCESTATRRGWCGKHYARWWKHGDPEHLEYPTPEENFAQRTEQRGDCLIWTGSATRDGYGRIWVKGRYESTHRYAWQREHGPIPDGKVIDHKDHCNPLCVNVKHLRLATHQQNLANRSGATTASKTGVRNVWKHGKKYQVQIIKNRKKYTFGSHETIEEAAEVAKTARQKLFGAYAGKG